MQGKSHASSGDRQKKSKMFAVFYLEKLQNAKYSEKENDSLKRLVQ